MGVIWLTRVVALAVAIGIGSGFASGLFLDALSRVTVVHTTYPGLLFGLPLAGVVIAWMYSGFGRNAASDSNLILDEIHERKGGVPFRMLPLVLASTLVTHLFGGSAGREGTAVQMGGALAGGLSRRFRLDDDQTRIALMCGISGGFSGVFGTPMAGTVFGMEMVALGGIRYTALVPCLISALVSHQTVIILDIPHAHYAFSTELPSFGIVIVLKVIIAGVAFGLVSAMFTELTHFIEHLGRRILTNAMIRTAIGGVVIIVVTLLLGTRVYNGLSLPLITAAFEGDVPAFAFFFKLLLTAITLGFGFKGGEVTPLFVIGSTLGVTLATPLGLPPDFLAGLGFVAVFAAAANTPLACVILGAELFGQGIVFFGIAVFIAYAVSGHRGIYASQRIIAVKGRPTGHIVRDSTLKQLRGRSKSDREQPGDHR